MQNVIASSSSSSSTIASGVVVQNDSATATKTALPVFTAIEQLVIEHDVWHNGAFRTSNEQLYVLLQKCYALYKGMEGKSKDAAEKRMGLEQFINLKALRVQADSHTLTKIVKCVFGVDRRRVSAYSIALRVADKAKIEVLDLPAFIRNAGGVEEVRRSAATTTGNVITPAQKVAIANDAVAQKTIAVIKSEQLGMELDAGKIGKNVVLIGTWEADGSVIVRAVVQNDSVVKSALATYYVNTKSEQTTKATEKAAANDADARQAAVKAAAAMVA